MSVTELRDDQANEWHSWADRNRDDVLAHNKRRRDELAAETSGKKVRLCEFVDDEGEPCLRAHQARGYCKAHWRKLRDGKPMIPIRESGRTCAFVDPDGAACGRRHKARGYCDGHLKQVRDGRPLSRLRSWGPWRNATPTSGARDGEPWTEWEFDLAMSDTPLREVALRLGRTYSSVVRARQRRRRMLGLGIEYTKSEADPYDGSDRRGVLYAKDKK